MTELEFPLLPLADLLDTPEFSSGKHDPASWPSYREGKIREDLRFRGIFAENSIPSLLPTESNGQPAKVTAALKAMRMIGLTTIEELAVRDFNAVNNLWNAAGKGRNSLTHRAALAFWAESQQKRSNTP